VVNGWKCRFDRKQGKGLNGEVFEVEKEGLPPLFTPECCRDLAETLHAISREWVASLGAFRKQALRI
jgi:hypothetical protein